MKELSKEDIPKNRVDTIEQFYILDYLKKNININEFKIYLNSCNKVKVVDKTEDILYFNCDSTTREITYQEILKEIEYEKEI